MAPDGIEADTAARRQRPRPAGRRLSDRILAAFHQACDQGDLDVAGALLGALETLVCRPGPLVADRRRERENLVAAHERLWTLRDRQNR